MGNMSNFTTCIEHVLAADGGLVNHPKDPGGVTKFGISQPLTPPLATPPNRSYSGASSAAVSSARAAPAPPPVSAGCRAPSAY